MYELIAPSSDPVEHAGGDCHIHDRRLGDRGADLAHERAGRSEIQSVRIIVLFLYVQRCSQATSRHGHPDAFGSTARAALPCCRATSRSAVLVYRHSVLPSEVSRASVRCSSSARCSCFQHSWRCACALISAGRVPGAGLDTHAPRPMNRTIDRLRNIVHSYVSQLSNCGASCAPSADELVDMALSGRAVELDVSRPDEHRVSAAAPRSATGAGVRVSAELGA